MLVFSKKVSVPFFATTVHFFAKIFFFIRVDRRVVGVEDHESEVSFFEKNVCSVFCDNGTLFCKNKFFYKG